MNAGLSWLSLAPCVQCRTITHGVVLSVFTVALLSGNLLTDIARVVSSG